MKYLLLVLLNICLCTQNIKANTNLQITVHASNVANLYYQIYENNNPVEKKLTFHLKCDTGKQYLLESNDSILFIQNIPFGNYTLIYDDVSFPIKINQAYLKTQHELKKIDLYNQTITPNTSDYFLNDFILFIFSFFVLLLLLFLAKES